jgi:hypothetical protein
MAVFFDRRRAPRSGPYSPAGFPTQEASRIALSSRRTPGDGCMPAGDEHDFNRNCQVDARAPGR